MGQEDSSWLERLGEPTMRMLIKRVEDRLARAESPPSVSLPPSKTGFPKLLCLDQNKWIEMARAHYGKAADPDATAALAAIRDAVTRGTLVIPMMPTNLDEAMEPEDEARRTRIATFIVEASHNFSFRNWKATDDAEARHSIRKNILEQSSPPPVRPTLIHWGVDAAVSVRPHVIRTDNEFLDVVVNQVMKEPEMSIAALVHAMDQATILNARAIDGMGAARLEGNRAANAAIPVSERRRIEMFNLLDGGTFAETVRGASEALGVPPRLLDLWRSSEELLLRLTGDMPSVDVEYTLITARERNKEDKTQPNDFKDMTFLKQALPYGNMVVTENRWAHLANAEGLARRHRTRVLAKLAKLPEALQAEGCI